MKIFIYNQTLFLYINRLRKIVKNHLHLDVPESYYGMVKNQYYKHLDKDSKIYNPSPKSYLYVYRGLMTSKYVQDKEDVVAILKSFRRMPI
jgi:predicted nucleotidyltransferase